MEIERTEDSDITFRSGSHAADALLRDDLLNPDLTDSERLIERIAADQMRRHRTGRRVPIETYLNLRPSLAQDAEALFELVYGEFVLRESLGETPTHEEFAWRFPSLADRLRRQIDLHDALASNGLAIDPPSDPAEYGRLGVAKIESTSPGQTLGDGGSRDHPNRDHWPVVPGFQIVDVLGRGGMGIVYKAVQLSLKRLVALKMIRDGACARRELKDRFRAEAEAVARFQHPNIVQVYEVGECSGSDYLVLEYVSGGSLKKRIEGAPWEPRKAALLCEELARAIHYAHQRGIIHRDLKPDNVLIDGDGVVKVTDFGLAKLVEEDEAGLTLTGAIIGTPSYMAPEQTRGAYDHGKAFAISPATDVHAIGAMLYELMTGRPPFKGATPLSTLELVAKSEPVPPGMLERHTPKDLETICLRCLEKDPSRRYPSAQELADDLRRWLDGRPIVARPASILEKAWKWARRRPTIAASIGALSSLILLIFFGTLYYNSRLRDSANAASKAANEAGAKARQALEERDLAISILDQLIFQVPDRLGDSPQSRPLKRMILGEALKGLEKLATSQEFAPPDISRAAAHVRLGQIFGKIGRDQEAYHQFERARDLAENLEHTAARNFAIAEYRNQARIGLGELKIKQGKLDEAIEDFRQAVMLSEVILRDSPSRPNAKARLIEAYLRLGRAHGFRNDFDSSRYWIEKARDLAQAWAKDDSQNPRPKEFLAWSLRKLADAYKLANQLEQARGDYKSSIDLARELAAADPNNLSCRNHLAMGLDDLAGVETRLGRAKAARALYEEAELLFSKLAASDPEDLDAGFHAANARIGLARIDLADGHQERARAEYRKSIDEVSQLKEKSEPASAGWLDDVVRTWKKEFAQFDSPPAQAPQFESKP